MEYIIETKKLTKRYGKETSVNGVDLHIPKGCVYGFLGPNGAGKTTTMKMMLGLAKKTKGEILLFGSPLCEKNRLDLLSQIGSLIETPSYYAHLTAYENLEITCVLRGIDKRQIFEVLQIVGLTDTGKKQVSKFSLGMKQRLGIANALLGKPKLLLLDEPTNGLDPAGIAEIRALIKRLPALLDTTVLISSHLLSEIEQIADVVSIIDHGKILFEGTLDSLREKSKPHLSVATTDDQRAVCCLPDVTVTAEGLTLPAVDTDGLIAMQEALRHHHIYMTRIVEHRKSLEELFLEMTTSEVTV